MRNSSIIWLLCSLFVVPASCDKKEEQRAPATATPTVPATTPASPQAEPTQAEIPVVVREEAPVAQPPVKVERVNLSEVEKIEQILTRLTKSDAIFIRNSNEYDGKTAASHLRTKWSAAGSRVKTAKDFIEALASKSSSSGKPYQIREKDGTLLSSQEWFERMLADIETGK
jgi:hypothetical protein